MTKKECPRCKGKGYITGKYKGGCIDGLRHCYSRFDGSRSEICLLCGKPTKKRREH